MKGLGQGTHIFRPTKTKFKYRGNDRAIRERLFGVTMVNDYILVGKIVFR